MVVFCEWQSVLRIANTIHLQEISTLECAMFGLNVFGVFYCIVEQSEFYVSTLTGIG